MPEHYDNDSITTNVTASHPNSLPQTNRHKTNIPPRRRNRHATLTRFLYAASPSTAITAIKHTTYNGTLLTQHQTRPYQQFIIQTNIIHKQNLNNPQTFHPLTLQKIKDLLSAPTPRNSFAPLRSFHRLILSYPPIDAAIATRQLLDGTTSSALHSLPSDNTKLIQDRIRIYFGEPTPVAGSADDEVDRHLKAPSLGKLLFISPPPSPPCGWEIREEDPPNKETHAEDLQRALAGLNSTSNGEGRDDSSDVGREVDGFGKTAAEGSARLDVEGRRKRSSSTTMVYHPRDHGDREDLPAVWVEDTTTGDGEEEDEENEKGDGIEWGTERGGRVVTKTSRPPVELMEE